MEFDAITKIVSQSKNMRRKFSRYLVTAPPIHNRWNFEACQAKGWLPRRFSLSLKIVAFMFSYIFTDGVELCKYFFRFPLGVAKPMLSKLCFYKVKKKSWQFIR